MESSREAPCRAVLSELKQLRKANVAAGGIPRSVPIHITEDGWPTAPARTYEQQAAVIQGVVSTLHEHRPA